MSKQSKRTISSLLKSRPKGRFAPKGFDLLGEGDRLVREEGSRKDAITPTPKAIAENASGSISARSAPTLLQQKTNNLDGDSFIGNSAIAKFAHDSPAVKNAYARTPIAKSAADKSAAAKNAKEKISAKDKETFRREALSVEKNATANPATVSNIIEQPAGVKSANAKVASAKISKANSAIKKSTAEVITIANISLVNNAIARNAAEEFDAVKDADAMSAIARFVREKSAIEEIAVEKGADVKFASRKNANKILASEESANKELAAEEITASFPEKVKEEITEKTEKSNRVEEQEERKTQDEKKRYRQEPKVAPMATKVAYRQAQEELARLRSERKTSTLIDNYIVDNLLAQLGPTQAIIYIYLWRRIVGSGVSKISLSMQILSDAVGISKRTAQEAIKKLNELKLLKSEREGETGVSEHRIFKPWEKLK